MWIKSQCSVQWKEGMDSNPKKGDDIFECKQCGVCCQGYGGTYVTEQDILRIAAFIHTDPDTFISQYCDQSGSRPVLTQGEDGKCIFFKSNCSIHPVKPFMCRAWPFIKAVVTHPENWDAMAGSCPGIVKDVQFEELKRIVSMELKKIAPYSSILKS